MADIKWDKGALERAAKEAVKQALPGMQREFDALGRRSKGKPVESVKRDVKQLARKLGLELSDRDVTAYAETMAEGTRIKLQV